MTIVEKDEALLVEQAQRDPRAFGALYDCYADRVYRFCYRRSTSHYEAEELTAQTFRRALEGLPRFEWRGAPFGAWLFRIAANLVADRASAVKRSVSLEALAAGGREIAGDSALPLDGLLEAEEIDLLWEAVYRLPLYQQQVLVLRYAQGLGNQEVARIVNRSETATKQLVHRSLKALRALLKEEDEG